VIEHEKGEFKAILECYFCRRVYSSLTEWFQHYSSHMVHHSERGQSNGKEVVKIEVERAKAETEVIRSLQDENNLLRQIVMQLGNNSILLMDKINNQDKTLKQWTKNWKSISIARAPINDLKYITLEQEKLSSNLLTYEETLLICVICLDNKRETVCFPCGHFIYCRKCTPSIQSNPKCAICMREVTRFETVYFV